VKMDNSVFLCPFHDAFAQGRAANFGKQGENVDLHEEANVQRSTPNVQ